ncbi:aminopeptidase [Paramaledivibacter caminithermalis]|jgi:aminopeptidase|uniref:Leucyl aminopeptidase (Aminopeptidase T) n=1 Tax=Paramaledivibacter caminithermalis (strain DSM 15212 / CIP 107654 / DViRD3) TaxID=1121301 RepID=A0A1M6P3M8_PARC5|nr:aminopeptidase [Paramaledivibacter caminithermalis]SHK02506.1 Leucyl aminopeptidase (aminopeptidase T) [Paramaledivibacter caminithermalis DSM 15212]
MLKHDKLSKLLIEYCLEVQEGDRVLICGTSEIKDLLPNILSMVLDKKAYVAFDIKHPELEDIIIFYGSSAQIKFLSSYLSANLTKFNKMINFISDKNLFFRSNQNKEKLQAFYSGKHSYIETYLNHIKEKKLFCTTVLYPTTSYAQYSKMPDSHFKSLYNEYCFLNEENFLLEYRKLEAFNNKIISFLDNIKEIRIKGKKTDLVMEVQGGKWINGSGKINIPDGEVFTAPIKESVNGRIFIDYPIIYNGIEIKELELFFKEGRLIEFKCSNNEAFEKIISIDNGACYLGEIGFGTNHKIHQYIGNIIFDEKMGGTGHIALGSSYPECGKNNVSQIHLDMVFDSNKGKVIYADNQIFLEDRKYYINAGDGSDILGIE